MKDGTAEAPDFANALGQVLSTAGQMGATFADTTAAIAAMTLKGMDADTAATSLNQIFVSLLKTTPQADAALAGGRTLGQGAAAGAQGEGAARRPPDTPDEASRATTPRRLTVFGNVRALRGVLSLLGGDAGQVAGVFNDVSNGTANLATAFADTEGPGREMDRAITRSRPR